MTEIEKSTHRVRRRRLPGELATPMTAIRNHCLECCGWQSAEVRRCTAPKCWLYPYRMGSGREAEKIAVAELKTQQGAFPDDPADPEPGEKER